VAFGAGRGARRRAADGLLADAVGVAPRQVALVAGEAAREKRVRISGDAASLMSALARLVDVKSKMGT
jgi:uncharacterized protein YggU (UPF0235/DUF167 family)